MDKSAFERGYGSLIYCNRCLIFIDTLRNLLEERYEKNCRKVEQLRPLRENPNFLKTFMFEEVFP